MPASSAPEAPRQCPVSGFVEEHGGGFSKIVCIARASISSFKRVPVPCRFTYWMDSEVSLAFCRASRMASTAPRPCGSGADMWCASLDSPTPSSWIPPSAFSSMKSPAPSPMFNPLRFLLIGLLISSDSNSSAENPLRVSSHNESAPPTTTASHSPISKRACPDANTLPLEEHAVEIV